MDREDLQGIQVIREVRVKPACLEVLAQLVVVATPGCKASLAQ